MTKQLLELIRDMVTTALLIILIVWLSFVGHYLGETITLVSEVNRSLNGQITVLVSQVRELQAKVARLEGRQVIGE